MKTMARIDNYWDIVVIYIVLFPQILLANGRNWLHGVTPGGNASGGTADADKKTS